jgi:uncharacterized membrane protein YfcA
MAYNPFPEILWIGPLLSPLILRAGIGIVLLILLLKTTSSVSVTPPPTKHRVIVAAVFYGVLSFCTLTGFLTQYASIVGVAGSLYLLTFGKKYPEIRREPKLFYILLLTTFISLLLTGAGPLSLDSPL